MRINILDILEVSRSFVSGAAWLRAEPHRLCQWLKQTGAAIIFMVRNGAPPGRAEAFVLVASAVIGMAAKTPGVLSLAN